MSGHKQIRNYGKWLSSVFFINCLMHIGVLIHSQSIQYTSAGNVYHSSFRFKRNLKANGNEDVIPSLEYVGEPPLDPVTLQYGACQGRCTDHTHCEDGLYCVQRIPNDEIISTCLPALSTNETITNTLRLLNYCAVIPDNEFVTLTTGNTSSDLTTDSVSLTSQECKGGCMNDLDCKTDNMKCSLTSQSTIPGCFGYKHPLINYCYFDDGRSGTTTTSPTIAPLAISYPVPLSVPIASNKSLQYIGEPPMSSNPVLTECQGDCDSDWHCDFGLNCFKRSDDTPVPGCSSTFDDQHDIYSVDYCYVPPPGTLVIVQEVRNKTMNGTGAFGAGKCEGDCTSDSDCKNGLTCFIRYHHELVPGCLGVGAYATNYCYDPADDDVPVNGTSGSEAPTVVTSVPINEPTIAPRTSPSFIPPVLSVPISSTVMPTDTSGIIRPAPTASPFNTPTPITVTLIPTTSPVITLSKTPTLNPSELPSAAPTLHVTTNPSTLPSFNPSIFPSETKSSVPTHIPSLLPSMFTPSENPTVSLSETPSAFPSLLIPSENPTVTISDTPSAFPSSFIPSENPTVTKSDTPSAFPSSFIPSKNPTVTFSDSPSSFPSSFIPSENPTVTISDSPSLFPSSFIPSENPTVTVSATPSVLPSSFVPSENPTVTASDTPSVLPSLLMPSENPTTVESHEPSKAPSDNESSYPTSSPTDFISEGGDRDLPTLLPTVVSGKGTIPTPISLAPNSNSPIIATASPSMIPVANPSGNPTGKPSVVPSHLPTIVPTPSPSSKPSQQPSSLPTRAPSTIPSFGPSLDPSKPPSIGPSAIPVVQPSDLPSKIPSSLPSRAPSTIPTYRPSLDPTKSPSIEPSVIPIIQPSDSPSITPSINPTEMPTMGPSMGPSFVPSIMPTLTPTLSPSTGPSKLPTLLPTAETTISGDGCEDIALEERANIIFERLANRFEYRDELTLSNNETIKILERLFDRLFARDDEYLNTTSYQQMAYEWIVHNDTEQIRCPDSDNLFQRFALAMFYFACNGIEWTLAEGKDYLSSNSSECDWYGIACGDDNATVVGLHFDNSSITGTLPSELSILANIQELNMDSNQIGGSVPAWLNQWESLEVIDLDHNLLTGSIPSSLYSISSLRVLDLDSNMLTGTISETGLENWIDSLYFLQLDFNQFVGSLPRILGRFTELQYLSIFGNNFTDTILATIENLCNEATRTIYANCNLCQNSTCCAACLDV